MAKRQNWQLVKKDQTYTISELGELYSMSRSGIKYWIKLGLKPIESEEKKYYFRGEDVIVFLKKKNERKTLKIDVFKCFHRKGHHRIKSDKVTLLYTNVILGNKNTKQVKIIGNCEDCEGIVSKQWSERKLPEFLEFYPGIKIIKKVKSNS